MSSNRVQKRNQIVAALNGVSIENLDIIFDIVNALKGDDVGEIKTKLLNAFPKCADGGKCPRCEIGINNHEDYALIPVGITGTEDDVLCNRCNGSK
ncbi:hypothetical protein ACFL0K_02570 [Patescibacteria group bacterium]